MIEEECDHNWVEVIRDPWTIYYRCTKCGAESSEPNPLVEDDEHDD